MRETRGFFALGNRGGARATVPFPVVQHFSCLEKAGGRVEPLGGTRKKNHPVHIVRRMPLAYDNQRAPNQDTRLYFRPKTFVKTISSRSCARSLSASGAQARHCNLLSIASLGDSNQKGANGDWPHQSQSADSLTSEVLFLVVRSSRAVRTRLFPDLLRGTSNMPVPTRVHFRKIQLSYGILLWRK